MEFVSYLNAVRKHWWTLMSCAAFTLLGIYIAWADKNNAWTIRGLFSLALVLLFYAGFLAWKDERRGKEALEKNVNPSLTFKEESLNLSAEIIEFAYECAKDAPKPRLSNITYTAASQDAWRELAESGQHMTAVLKFQSDTHELFRSRYKRRIMRTSCGFHDRGIASKELNDMMTDPTVVSLDSIKWIGKWIGDAAETISEEEP